MICGLAATHIYDCYLDGGLATKTQMHCIMYLHSYVLMGVCYAYISTYRYCITNFFSNKNVHITKRCICDNRTKLFGQLCDTKFVALTTIQDEF